MPAASATAYWCRLLLQRLEHVPAAAGQLVGGEARGVARHGRERRVVRREDDGRLGEARARRARPGRRRRPPRPSGSGESTWCARRERKPSAACRWSTAITGAPAAASERMASRPLTKLTSSTTAGGSSERARRRPSASRRVRLIAARAPALRRRRPTGARPRRTPARAHAPGRAPASARRSRAVALPAANVSGSVRCTCSAPVASSICTSRLPVRDSASATVDVERVAAGRERDGRPRAVADERAPTARSGCRPCRAPRRARCAGPAASARVSRRRCRTPGDLRSDSAVDRDARGLDRARVVDVRCRSARCRRRAARRTAPSRPTSGGSRSSRMRPAPVTSSGPGGAMSSALADQLPGDRVGIARLARRAVALHEQRRGAGRVRRRGRGADHRDARPDGGRGRSDDIGLQPAVLGRALRTSSRRRRRPASRARRR